MALSQEEKKKRHAEAARRYRQKTGYDARRHKETADDYRQFSFRLSRKSDYVVIAKLDSVENRTDYIRNLILQDIASNS